MAAAPDPLVIALPEPCLVVLIGAAGSGKSTLAVRLFRPEEILSSDAYRAIVSGDEADQRVSKVAFSILHRELEKRMAAGRTTVVDATNVARYARRALVSRAQRHGIPAIAIVLDLNPALVHARNAARSGRVVPPSAVDEQLAALARARDRDELARDGFAAIHVIRTGVALDAASVRR